MPTQQLGPSLARQRSAAHQLSVTRRMHACGASCRPSERHAGRRQAPRRPSARTDDLQPGAPSPQPPPPPGRERALAQGREQARDEAGEVPSSTLEPYLLSERVCVVTAHWDPREHEAAEYAWLEERLLRAGARSVDLSLAAGIIGPDTVRLRATCPGGDRDVVDRLAGLVIEATAAADVRAFEELRCLLPQRLVPVDTPWGRVGVTASFKGAEVFKAVPDWQACDLLAAAAAGSHAPSGAATAATALGSGEAGSGGGGGGGGIASDAGDGDAAGSAMGAPPTAQDIAAAALTAFGQGIASGNIVLGTASLL